MGRHCAQKRVLVRPHALNANILSLQIGNAADAVFCKHLEAANVHTTQDGDRVADIDWNDGGRRVDVEKVDFAAHQRPSVQNPSFRCHVADFGKAFRAQQLIGHIEWGNADTDAFRNADGRCFKSPLLSTRTRPAEETRGTGGRERGEKAAPILNHIHPIDLRLA
jgi:hypothetical protein